MKSYTKNLEFAEFIKIFKDRYVYEDANGLTLIAMTSDEALLLSKYLFRGIAEWAAVPVDGAGGLPNLGESLERFAERNIRETSLELRATDEELRSLGMFLLRGLVGVILTLDQARVGLQLKYGGQGERAYCC